MSLIHLVLSFIDLVTESSNIQVNRYDHSYYVKIMKQSFMYSHCET